MELSAETLRFIREHADDDVNALALQDRKYPEVDMAAAVTQIAGRQIAARKIPSWCRIPDLYYPRHLSMEQCSSEAAALYKASLLKGETFTDLTGGLGVDCAFIARQFQRVDYVERQAELCELAAHNFPLLGLQQVSVHHRDAVEYLREMEAVDCLYLDPARRDGHGGKTVAISDCEPDVSLLKPLLVEKAAKVLVKLSPMLDVSLALNELKTVCEVHIVAVGNECKELLLVLQKQAVSSEIILHCVHIPNGGETQHFAFTREQERTSPCPMADEVGAYLYEPNAAILKAGAFCSLTQAYPVEKLQVNSHLYTSIAPVDDFPGRSFQVEAVTGFGKKELKTFLQGMDKANVTVRNFPLPVAELRKRLKLKEGGEVYLFATTLNDGQKVLIRCRKC